MFFILKGGGYFTSSPNPAAQTNPVYF